MNSKTENDWRNKTTPSSNWLAKGFESLLAELQKRRAGIPDARPEPDFDVVIVGSGYGGAMAAAELSRYEAKCENGTTRALKICVLERGNEYLAGAFPSRAADLPGHIRMNIPDTKNAKGNRDALFDVRVGPDVNVVLANGLGGGSLINAGVMERPLPAMTASTAWPLAFRDAPLREELYGRTEAMLGAGIAHPNNVQNNLAPADLPMKFTALQSLAGSNNSANFRPAQITVALQSGFNTADVKREKCNACGDCATGCNVDAKNSLDTNLLVSARLRGVEIFTGATVLRIKKIDSRCDEEGFRQLDVVYTDPHWRSRQATPFPLRARKVILAAGTLGSTEILMRSRSDELKLSPQLGQRFSTNGDGIALVYDQNIKVNALSSQSRQANRRHVGPTITGIIDLRGQGNPLLIEELAIPGPLQRVFEELAASSWSLRQLGERDKNHTLGDRPYGMQGQFVPNVDTTRDEFAINRRALRSTSVLALMGDDKAAGALEFTVDPDDDDAGDGVLQVRWPKLRDDKLYEDQVNWLNVLNHQAKLDGTVLPNPLWQPLPQTLRTVFSEKNGPLITVHPLGGCAMGENYAVGVVDYAGRVFAPPPIEGKHAQCGHMAQTTNPQPWHDGLVVLDGSIVPNALGTNPALTIASVALNAVPILAADWRYIPKSTEQAAMQLVRPRYAMETEEQPAGKVQPTRIELLERMAGLVDLGPKWPGEWVLEMTIRYKPTPLARLMWRGRKRLIVDTSWSESRPNSRVRLFPKDKWDGLVSSNASEQEFNHGAEAILPMVSGSLTVFRREATEEGKRRCAALHAWFANRGARDTWQALVAWLSPICLDGGTWDSEWIVFKMLRLLLNLPKLVFASLTPKSLINARSFAHDWLKALFALASRAGKKRTLQYDIAFGIPILRDPSLQFGEILALKGSKTITYDRRANPWNQLSRLTLEEFCGLLKGKDNVLKLDTKFLARHQIPLLRFVQQENLCNAYGEFASFGAYMARMLITQHLWTFRLPDKQILRQPNRLPGMVDGLPQPEIKEIELSRMDNGLPVVVRLTRYAKKSSTERPIVMIHGYSVSGTTFAHSAVKPNLASYFWNLGREVWILDLRTSSGLPTAIFPWTFEQVALEDIPAAFEYIHDTLTDGAKFDVLAHCMGSAMFSMAVLAPPSVGDRFFKARRDMPNWIHRVVLSQVGPATVFTADNVLRGYMLSFASNILPMLPYQFRPSDDSAVTEQLFDRLLYSMPYPDDEYDIENPPWYCFWRTTAFTATRHRMDTLYGCDFRLTHMPRGVLENIDDFFGPLNLGTISQASNFARLRVLTDYKGRNIYVNRTSLRER